MPRRVLRLAMLFFSLVAQACAIQLKSQTMQLKSGNMLGSVGITIAQWDLEFDEDVYYFEAPPCAPGLARQSLTSSAVAENPCWAGCDFTSSEPDKCGQPFDTSDPTCQQLCDNHPQKAVLCDFTNRPWSVIDPGVESPLFSININENLRLRFNWLLIEQGFRYDGMSLLGPVSVSGLALMDTAGLSNDASCFFKPFPASYANVCPSFQCFYYGTWEIAIGITSQSTITNYVGTSSHILRTFPQATGLPRRTQPRQDAPLSYPQQQYSPMHTPLVFGVTVTAQFRASDRALFYQLTTPYCGLINIQHEKAVWNRPTARVALGVSTDGTPFPTSFLTDVLFYNGSLKPMWICPRPPETNITVFFGVVRYAGTGEPALSSPETHYLTVDYYRPEDPWLKYRVGAQASESGYSNYSNFPPLSNWATGLAANLFRLSCPNPSSPSTSVEYIDCRSGSSGFGTCLSFLYGVPADPWSISLLPIPAVVSNINPEGFGNINYPALQPTASRKLSAFLVLELTYDGSVISQTLDADWQDIWSDCVLHIGTDTPVASLDGDWFFADLVLNQTVPECVYSDFEDLSQLITQGIETMANDPLSAYSERVLIDELTFHEPWQACNTFISWELSTTFSKNVSVFDSTACLDSSAIDDPCCNNDMSWRHCCAPRDFNAYVQALELNNASTNAVCRQVSCVEPLLDEYYRADLTDSIGGCSGPDLNMKLRAPLRVYRDCREAAFGDDFELPSCVVDADCTNLTVNTSLYCNQVTKQCAFSFSDSVTYFFGCVADNLPIETRIKLIALNEFAITKTETLADLLQNRYGKSSKCVDESFGSPWSYNNEFLQTGSVIGGCQYCNQNATDVSYQPPPWCEVRSGSKCTYDWIVQPGTVGCETQVCNWDQSNQCDTGLLGTSFCGVCETDAICTQVSAASPQSACEEIPSVCFLADGTVRTDLTEAECLDTFSCTLECSGGACGNRSDCEAVGYCETDDEIYEAMAASSWNYTASPAGFCTMPLQPFNNPDCTRTYADSLPTSFGCVVYANCTGLTSLLTCTPNYNTEALCATLSPHAMWWPRYDKESCLSARRCREQLVGIESLSSLGSRLRSPKNDEQCALCTGEMEALASWVSGRWLPGTARPAQWVERALASRYKITESVDFNALYNDIYASARAAVAFQLQNNIQCSYQTINALISKISCACTTDWDREVCFSGGFITSVGQGEVCPETSNTITAPPSTLSYFVGSVSSHLKDQCVELSIDRINSRFFYGETPPPISTGFVPKFTIRGWNAVVNDKGAMVGQVVGDGIQIHFNQNGEYLAKLKVCLLVSSSIPVDETEVFEVYGLGYWTGQKDPAKVIPYMHLANVTMANGYVCANVQLAQTGDDVSYVPIYYRSDWQEQPSARFSDGQLALLYIVATLYVILCFIIVVQLVRLIGVGAWDFTVGTNYMWVLLFFVTIIRAIYIYLVAADVLGQQNTHLLVDFWMMDLPTLLYLICNTNIAVSFLFLLLAMTNEQFQHRRYFWCTFAVLVGFIVAIFVGILLAFNYAVVSTQGSHGPALCSTFTDNSNDATIIRIVYESLLFTIALCIAFIAGLIAAKLWWQFRKQDGTSSLLWLGIASSTGILSDSLAFLIYYIVNQPTPYFAIVLIFTEIIPITFLVLRVSTKQIENKKRSSEDSPKPGSSSRGHSYSASPPNSYDTDRRLG